MYNFYSRSDGEIERLIWVTGQARSDNNQQLSFNDDNACDNLVRVKVFEEPNSFNNEALLTVSFIGPRGKFGLSSIKPHPAKKTAVLTGIQLIPCNVDLTATFVQGGQIFDINFGPCFKKAIEGGDIFQPTDGPIFTITSTKACEDTIDEVIIGN